jgi:superfamily II DNA/RNA helicase
VSLLVIVCLLSLSLFSHFPLSLLFSHFPLSLLFSLLSLPSHTATYVALKDAVPAHIRFPVAVERPTASRPPVVLILEPTRELAAQTHQALLEFSLHLKDPSLNILLVTGGQDAKLAVAQLRAGVDVVTATPGRLLDMVEAGHIDLSFVRFFVLDEADELLNTGNFGTITKVFGRLPKNCALQVLQRCGCCGCM